VLMYTNAKCSDIYMFFSYQVTGTSSVLMGNGSHATVHGVGTVDLKFTLGKTMRLKNMHHIPSINIIFLVHLLCVRMATR
jgi:hypothetical protein